jgi:hypothetical protein
MLPAVLLECTCGNHIVGICVHNLGKTILRFETDVIIISVTNWSAEIRSTFWNEISSGFRHKSEDEREKRENGPRLDIL